MAVLLFDLLPVNGHLMNADAGHRATAGFWRHRCHSGFDCDRRGRVCGKRSGPNRPSPVLTPGPDVSRCMPSSGCSPWWLSTSAGFLSVRRPDVAIMAIVCATGLSPARVAMDREQRYGRPGYLDRRSENPGANDGDVSGASAGHKRGRGSAPSSLRPHTRQ